MKIQMIEKKSEKFFSRIVENICNVDNCYWPCYIPWF